MPRGNNAFHYPIEREMLGPPLGHLLCTQVPVHASFHRNAAFIGHLLYSCHSADWLQLPKLRVQVGKESEACQPRAAVRGHLRGLCHAQGSSASSTVL